jgi:hypothetical protein
MFGKSFVRGVIRDIGGVISAYSEAQDREDAIVAELRSLVAAHRRLDAAKFLLPQCAARYGGPTAVEGIPITADLDASWGPFGPADRMMLANSSGIELLNCTILVELRGAGGEVAQDVHFVPRWASGAMVYAEYSAGVELLGAIHASCTPPRVESAVISVGADELKRESIAYTYAGVERDRDVEMYCKDMLILASYRPFAKGMFRNTDRGVTARLKGIARLERPRITVTFRRGGSELALYWDLAQWDDGETKTLDTAGRLVWDPESYEIAVTFPDTSYSYRGTWHVE